MGILKINPSNTLWDSVSISIRHADLYPCSSAWQIDPYILEYNGFFYIWKGIGWVELDGWRLDAQPGDLFLSMVGQRMSAGHDPNRPFTVLSSGFNLRGPGGVDVLRQITVPLRARLPLESRRVLQQTFTDYVAEYQHGGTYAQPAFRGSLLKMLAVTLRLVEELPASCLSKGVPPLAGSEDRVAAVVEFIEKNLSQPLNLHDLARVVHLSPVHFSAQFRRKTGHPPMAFLRRRRMEAARALLASTGQSIEQISRNVGFDDPFHFSRAFRQMVGVSPSAYRTSLKNPFLV